MANGKNDQKKPKGSINIGYGVLNPINSPDVYTNYDPNTTSGIDTLKKITAQNFTTNTLSNVDGFKAMCLRVDLPSQENSVGSWLSQVFFGKEPEILLSVKARIPELHASLPDPFIKCGNKIEIDNKIVDMHPTFIAVDSSLTDDVPAPGDILNVDFGDRINMKDPKYKGRILSNPVLFNVHKSAKATLANPSGGKLQTGTNDVASKSNTAPARAGGPCVRPARPSSPGGTTWSQRGLLRGKEYTFEATYVAGKHILDVRAAREFLKMQAAAAREGVRIRINSAFRLPEEQEYFWCKYKNGTGNVAARPGYSNHQSGVAMDLNTKGVPGDKARRRRTKISTGQGDVYNWLTKNASKYGFRRIRIEHWHWQHIPSLQSNRAKIKKSRRA